MPKRAPSSYHMVFLLRETYNVTEHSVVMGGHRIHGLLLSTFEVGILNVLLAGQGLEVINGWV